MVVNIKSQFQPGKSLDSLLAAVAVVIQQLLPDVDVAPGEEDESRRVVHNYLLHLAVGGPAAVVQKPAVAPRLLSGVNAESS